MNTSDSFFMAQIIALYHSSHASLAHAPLPYAPRTHIADRLFQPLALTPQGSPLMNLHYPRISAHNLPVIARSRR